MSKGPKHSVQYYKKISKKFKEKKRQFNILTAVKMLKKIAAFNQRKIDFRNKWISLYS